MRLGAVMLACMTLVVASAHAQTSGGRALSFLRMDAGAEGVGTGGACVASAGSPTSLYYNPAAIGGIEHIAVAATQSSLSLSRRIDMVAAVFPIKGAVLAIDWTAARVDNLEYYDSDGRPTGAMPNHENAFGFAFVKSFGKSFAAGLHARYVQRGLADLTVNSVFADVGVYTTALDGFALGATVQNLGSSFAWNTVDFYQANLGRSDHEVVPMTLRVGARWLTTPLDGAQAEVDGAFTEGELAQVHLGAQYLASFGDDRIAARLGTCINGAPIAGGVGYSHRFGFGRLGLDYAIGMGVAGTDAGHTVSLSYSRD